MSSALVRRVGLSDCAIRMKRSTAAFPEYLSNISIQSRCSLSETHLIAQSPQRLKVHLGSDFAAMEPSEEKKTSVVVVDDVMVD